MCSLTHLSQTYTYTHSHNCTHPRTRTHTQCHVQHIPDVHINTASYTAHMLQTRKYILTKHYASFKCKSDQILSILPISHIHNALMTRCLYGSNLQNEVKCGRYTLTVGAVLLWLHHRWARVFAAEVKFVILQYMSSAVAERPQSESESYKQGCCQTVDMSFKEGKTDYRF